MKQLLYLWLGEGEQFGQGILLLSGWEIRVEQKVVRMGWAIRRLDSKRCGLNNSSSKPFLLPAHCDLDGQTNGGNAEMVEDQVQTQHA